MSLLRTVVAAILTVTVATPAMAEVSDKIPSVEGLWGWALGLSLVALVLGLVKPAAALAVWPFALLLAYGQYEMISDPHIGAAILREQGQAYLDAVNTSSMALIVGPLLACLIAELWGRRRRTKEPASD